MTTTEVEHKIQSSYSGLSTHRRCPQQYFYKNVLRLDTPEGEVAPERDLGSWWSVVRAAEAVERGKRLNSLRQDLQTQIKLPDNSKVTVEVITVDLVMRALGAWWENQRKIMTGEGETAADVWEARLGGAAPELLDSLLARHLERWEDELENEQPIAVELFWHKQLPQPKNDPWQTEYPQMSLIGFIDEVYWDARRKMVVVRDHKTTKQLDAATSVDDMMDSQLHLYAWGANDVIRKMTGGKSVKAVAYDRARSIAPKPPQLTKSGRLSVYKGEPSVSSTDLQTYLAWVASKPEYPGLKKDGSGAGIYESEEKVIEKLKSPEAQARWFQRTLTPLNRNLIQTHLRAAVDSSVDAYRTEYRSTRTKEAQRNLGKICSWCDFASLCRAQMIGGARGTYELAEYNLVAKNGLPVLDKGQLVTLQEARQEEFDL